MYLSLIVFVIENTVNSGTACWWGDIYGSQALTPEFMSPRHTGKQIDGDRY